VVVSMVVVNNAGGTGFETGSVAHDSPTLIGVDKALCYSKPQTDWDVPLSEGLASHIVMARLVRANYRGTYWRRDSPDKPHRR